MPWWQWIALPLVLTAAWLCGTILGQATVSVARRLARRTQAKWDDELADRLDGPATLAWTMLAAQAWVALLRLPAGAEIFLGRIFHAGLFVAFFWALARAVDVGSILAKESGWAHTYPQSRALVPLGSRVAKVAVVAIALVAVLAELGYPVASLIAGLGIGGLAVALAAQKTLENLFGAFTIGVDQPFRVGDYIKLADVSGTVEEIGLRSTRLRTLDRTIVTIPNGKLVEMQVETFAPRDRFRLAHTLRLAHGTEAAQVKQIVAGLEAALRAAPKLAGEPSVRLTAIAELGLVIEVYAYLDTTDDAEFQRIREDLLLAFLAVVEGAGARLAVPVRSIVQASPEAPARL